MGHISTYDDAGYNGKSEIDYFNYNKGTIDLEFTFKPGAETPFIFTIQDIGTPQKPLDISDYESITLKFNEFTLNNILLFLKTYVPGISKGDNPQSFRHNSYVMDFFPNKLEYTIPLDNFTTGSWWYESMGLKKSDLSKENYSRLISFDMHFNSEGFTRLMNIPQKVRIKSIHFNKPMGIINILIFIFLILYYIGLIAFFIVKKIKTPLNLIPNQKHIKFESYREQNLQRIINFIEEHYYDPDISTQMLYQALGIPQKKIFTLILNEYGLTFKQLINKMRIEEAKRLLSESDLRVTDIAIKIGFNELTYFNRLFKEEVKMTPTDYRDKQKK